MNRLLLLFRLLVIAFITMTFIISYKLEDEMDVFIMFYNIVFTTAFIIAESVNVFDNQARKNQ